MYTEIRFFSTRAKVRYRNQTLVLPDGVACAHSNPLWDWSVLLLLFSKVHLGPKGLVGSLKV